MPLLLLFKKLTPGSQVLLGAVYWPHGSEHSVPTPSVTCHLGMVPSQTIRRSIHQPLAGSRGVGWRRRREVLSRRQAGDNVALTISPDYIAPDLAEVARR